MPDPAAPCRTLIAGHEHIRDLPDHARIPRNDPTRRSENRVDLRNRTNHRAAANGAADAARGGGLCLGRGEGVEGDGDHAVIGGSRSARRPPRARKRARAREVEGKKLKAEISRTSLLKTRDPDSRPFNKTALLSSTFSCCPSSWRDAS